MQRRYISSFSAAALVLVLELASPLRTAAAFTTKGHRNKTTCPAEALPDEETATALYFLDAFLEPHKRGQKQAAVEPHKRGQKQAAVFSFMLDHRDVEIPRCDDMDVPDACCATNEAQFVSVTLQLDPARCASRRALKGLKIRLDGRVVPNRDVAVRPKAGTVTLKRLPTIEVPPGDFGYSHSLDVIMPQDTDCTSFAFQGRPDAWPCAEDGCGYQAVTTMDARKDNGKKWPARPIRRYPKLNKTEEGCCVSYGASEPSGGGISFTGPGPADIGVGPPPGAKWCDDGGITANGDWDVQVLGIGDWGAAASHIKEANNQKLVAKGMAAVADDCTFERVINVGDNFYEQGLLSGRAIPEGYTDYRARFQQTWTDIYHGAYASLANLVWYSTYGNHDIGIYKPYKINSTCFAPEGQTWTHEKCLYEVDCCASPLWQNTDIVNDPQWVQEPGQYTTIVEKDNLPLIEFFFLDSNPFIDKYFDTSLYAQSVPGGLGEWRAVRNQTMADFLSAIQNSNATWKIPVIHTSLASWGSHCGFNKRNAADKSPDYPDNNPLDKKDCQYFVDLRRELLNMNIPLTMHGHDHNQQFVRLPAGFDGTTGSAVMYVLTTGGGCKQSSVVPGHPDMQIWPRNACGGGNPCKGEVACNMNNVCATYSTKEKTWSKNRVSPPVGFASLQVRSNALLVRVFEWAKIPASVGLAPHYQLVEVVQQLIQNV